MVLIPDESMDRIDRDTLSSATIKTDNGSKVLPGDKQGLPCEVWAIIFSFLPAEDLCRCMIVCKTWTDLVVCLDNTKWKDLYLRSTLWRQPNWPLNLHSEPLSWRLAYKEKYIQSHFWTRVDRDESSVTCMSVFRRQRARKTITVGIEKEHPNLKSALTVANEYDRILVYPGIYDEQFEMVSKIPFELIGVGELGSVILVVCIEQTAITGHISNLVFRAPWFTNFILKVRSGYLQVDNCIMEDGMVYIQNPGSISAHFCTFRHTTLILQHVNACIIQNCEFSQTDSAAITVEGYPKEEKNWTYQSMVSKMMALCELQQPDQQKSGEMMQKSTFSTVFSLSTATTHKKSANRKKCDDLESKYSSEVKTLFQVRKQSYDFDMESHDIETHSCDMSDIQHGAKGEEEKEQGPGQGEGERNIRNDYFGVDHSSQSVLSLSLPHSSSEIVIEDTAETRVSGSKTFPTRLPNIFESPNRENSITNNENNNSEMNKSNQDKFNRIQSFVSDCAKYGNKNDDDHEQQVLKSHNNLEGNPTAGTSGGEGDNNDVNNVHVNHDITGQNVNQNVSGPISDHQLVNVIPNLDLQSLASHEEEIDADEKDTEGGGSTSSSTISLVQSASSDDTEEEVGQVGRAYGSDGMSSSSFDDSLPLSDKESEFLSSEESVIMLQCPERHQPRSLSAQKDYNDVMSLNSQNQSEHIDIIEDGDMRKILNDVRGCFIHKCRITQCKGGVMVSLQAHAIVLECEINSVGYGVRCIQNSRTVILKNEIHHCRTSGVFMRLAASGLVTGNDIHSNCEAGVDIRKNADPVVQCNRIHHGKRSGVVVLGSGRGQIRRNDIYQNKEAGVYILYRGNPVVCHNQIYSGKAAGIAINEGGRGYIHDNTITGNQWGGIDIRRGGDPVIYHNTVCNGISDGIVIGEEGRGSIENNIITGNAGCGVWIMAAHQPLIHGNEIHSNRDSGISLVNKMDTTHKNEAMVLDNKDTQSNHSQDFWNHVNSEDNYRKKRLVTMATVEYNKVYHNDGCGVSIQFGEGVIIQSNYVYANRLDGVFIDQPFPAVVKENCISSNHGNGIQVTSEEKVEIRGNGIYDNQDNGISCECDTEMIENDILGNCSNGVILKNTKNAKVKDNRIFSQTGYCVVLEETQSCDIVNNSFYNKDDRTIQTEDGSQCCANNNQILSVPSSKQIESLGQGHQDISMLCSTRWVLTDPPARPHIDRPTTLSYTPHNHITTITRVTIPAENCEHGSKFCVIL